MPTLTPTRIPSLAPQPLRLAWQALRDIAMQGGTRCLRHQERRATEHALRTLSPHLLRDLGFDRSEIGSLVAEIGDQATPPRVRVLQAFHGLRA